MTDGWYEIMELSSGASLEDIKKQYRFLCQVWHPDRFSSSQHKAWAEEKMKSINAAYAVLSDPHKRADYNAGRATQKSWEQKQRQRQEEEQQRQEAERRRQEEQNRQHQQVAARNAEWAREITYRAVVHPIRSFLGISPEGVQWQRQNFPLDSITRVRWGGSRISFNGKNEFEMYTIAFGNDRTEAVVPFLFSNSAATTQLGYIDNFQRDENINTYNEFLDKLWRAVGVRLLGEMLITLKSGRDLSFGDALVHDDGVTLVKHKFLGADGKVKCAWGQVHVWSEDGLFYIGSRNDKKMCSKASYISDANTHIVERAIRMALEKPGMRRLSDLLQ
jgi:hypothetical protein